VIHPDFMNDGLVEPGTPVEHVVVLHHPDGSETRHEVTEVVAHDDGSYSLLWDAPRPVGSDVDEAAATVAGRVRPA
jgi:hypothetical protein